MNKEETPETQSAGYEVTVLLPAYNEAGVIGATVEKIRALHPDVEILVVDDGSSDNTPQEAAAAGGRVISHPYNIGNGAAVKTGLRHARGKWLVMMDADGQHRPEDIARLLEHKGAFDMVVGARTRQSETSTHRDMANWVYNRFASYVTQFPIQDLTSGFRLVRLSVARQFIYLLPNSFSYPSTLTLGYLHSGFSVKYIPIKARARIGKSKIKLFQDGIRFLLIIAKIATFFSPFRVFVPISLALFLTGMGYYGYTLLHYHRFTNMSALLFSSSLIIFMIGLVAEQVNQMRYDRVE